jgi:hypothetical protein
MVTYALLIYRCTPPSEPLPELDKSLDGHRLLQADAAAHGQLHAVARLGDADLARTVKRREGAHEMTDGPYIETKEWLVGFYLVDCKSEEEALSRARLICADTAHAVEVRPVAWKWKP